MKKRSQTQAKSGAAALARDRLGAGLGATPCWELVSCPRCRSTMSRDAAPDGDRQRHHQVPAAPARPHPSPAARPRRGSEAGDHPGCLPPKHPEKYEEEEEMSLCKGNPQTTTRPEKPGREPADEMPRCTALGDTAGDEIPWRWRWGSGGSGFGTALGALPAQASQRGLNPPPLSTGDTAGGSACHPADPRRDQPPTRASRRSQAVLRRKRDARRVCCQGGTRAGMGQGWDHLDGCHCPEDPAPL